MNADNVREDVQETAANQFDLVAGEPGTEELAAWEQIEAGRYMPRRIRGSFRGRALG